MTTTTRRTTEHDTETVEPELCWLNLTDLAPHPDNPRTSLGDLTELTRSIRSHGILQPLVVLPADDRGVYRIVAGHRRYAAGVKAELTDVPAVIRPMTTTEVVEAMLSENVNRDGLTIAEEVRAVERLMSLDSGLTPPKLCKRIGRSQSWVRARMAVAILPPRWRDALDNGDLTLAAGEAAASVADLGPEHLDAVCEQLAGRSWAEPARTVASYRDDIRRAEAYAAAVEKARAKHAVVFTDDDPAPSQAKRLGEMFDPDTVKAHRKEPCHAVVLRHTSWGDGHDTYEVCVDPKRHSPSRVTSGTGSQLTSDYAARRASGGSGDDSHAKRKGRLARIAHATETFAKTRRGLNQADLTRVALRGLIFEAGRDAIVNAATFLGYEQPRDATANTLLDSVDTPAALARVAGAVALGQAETRMYWSAASPQCRDYLDVLTGSGWEPDTWTAAELERNAAHDGDDGDADDEADGEEGDDDSDI
jgi:ParB/RepB/Spo0J family partition protein